MERRWAVWVSAGLLAGIYLREYWTGIDAGLLPVVAVLGMALVYGLLRHPKETGVLLAALVLGALRCHGGHEQVLKLERLEGLPVEVSGTVYGLEGLGDSLVLRDAVIRSGAEVLTVPMPLRLRLPDGQTVPEGLSGSEVRIRLPWEPATGTSNPGGFDYAEYLNRCGYQNELSVRVWQMDAVGKDAADPTEWLYRMRSAYGKALLRVLPLREGSVAYGMAIGDTCLIPEDLMADYRASGLGHLLSVSGLHFMILYEWMRRVLGRLPMGQGVRNGLILGVLTLMGFLNGWTAPALRAWGMIGLLVAAKACHRRYDGLTALALVAGVSVLWRPLEALQPGFQFSYAAVLGLIALTGPLGQRLPMPAGHLREYLAATLAVQVGVMPLSLYWFGFWNPVTLLVNFPAAVLSEWLMPALVLFPVLASLGPLGEAVSRGAVGGLVWAINGCGGFLSDFTREWLFPSPPLWALLGVLVASVLAGRLLVPCCGGEERRNRTHGLMLIILAALLTAGAGWSPDPKVLWLSVGQGDCALVRAGGESVLIDTGPAKARVDNLLLRNGVSRLDTLVITHGHEDHIGGALDLLKHLKVGRILLGARESDNPLFCALVQAAERRAIPIEYVRAGDRIRFGEGEHFDVLYPLGQAPEENLNNHSVVLMLESYGTRVLLTGDLEAEGEQQLLKQGLLKPVDVVKVPHHGSKTSSSPEWLQTLDPEWAVISVGPNYFGHPNRGIIDAYQQSGASVHRTDRDGALELWIRPGGSLLRTFR